MHRKLSEADSEKLANELAGLGRLSGEKLNQHFKIMYRADPPPRMRRALLIQALAYRCRKKPWAASSPPRGGCWPAPLTTPGATEPCPRRASARSSPGQLCCGNGTGFSTG